jgi:hypothetical protein
MILTEIVCLCKYSDKVRNPIGYISKTDVDGITSLMGPKTVGLSLKLKMLGGCMRIKSDLDMVN